VAPPGVDHEPRAWRERVLAGLLWTVAVAFACVAPWIVMDGLYGEGGQWLYASLGALCLATALGRRRVPYAFGTIVVLGSATAAATYGVILTGYAPNAFTTFGFVAVAATLLLGVYGGVALVALIAAILIAVPALHGFGALQRMDGWAATLDSARPSSAPRVAVIFIVMSMSSVLAISYLLRRAEDLLRERTLSLERLAAEQAEKERIQKDLMLREAAFRKAAELEVLARLAGSMAHDFNNALLVIYAALDTFAQAELAPDLATAADAVQAAATQAASATRQLRAFQRPHAADAPARVPLAASVNRLGMLLRRVLPSNVRLQLALEGADGLVILADEGEVHRMLMNLVLNARDATREGGQIVIRVERAELSGRPSARIAVSDDGAGMSEEVQRHLFEPFYTTKGGAGTGLGLASVRELVEAAGGRVGVESQLGRGSTVSVDLPLADAEAQEIAPSDTVAELDGTGINVLLVDDDRLVRVLLAGGLRRLGFAVVEAADGDEGLMVVRRHREPLHVLCTDCIMPGVPMRDLSASFRKAYPEASVLACSGYTADETGLNIDAVDAFLSKPFAIHELARRIVDLRRRVGPARAAAGVPA